MIILSLMIALSSALAQTPDELTHKGHKHTGKYVLGGYASFWSNTAEKTTSLILEPEFGYLFDDSWGAGTRVVFQKGVDDVKYAWGISPYARYYYLHKLPFNFYIDAGFGWNRFTMHSGEVLDGFEAGLRPGACIDLTEGVCLCLHFGFIGYRKDYLLGEEENLAETGFGISFAPEELRIGLELEF